jgi:hypothetical protein
MQTVTTIDAIGVKADIAQMRQSVGRDPERTTIAATKCMAATIQAGPLERDFLSDLGLLHWSDDGHMCGDDRHWARPQHSLVEVKANPPGARITSP